MASVTKRGNSWSVIWREDGRQQRKTFVTREDALIFKADTEGAVRRGRRTTATGKATFGTWWDTYSQQRPNVRASTLLRSQQVARAHLLPRWADTRLVDITHSDIQGWIGTLDVAPATVKKVYQELKSCLAAAVRSKALTENPCDGILLPKATKHDMTIVTPVQLAALADAVPDRHRALVLTLGYAGLRIGEALALVPSDVAHGYVNVSKTLTQTASGYEAGSPKSSAGVRSVPTPGHLQATLTEHLASYPGPYVFSGEQGGRLQAHNFSQRTFKRAVEDVLDRPMRVHDLRHTAITYWIQAGIPLPQVVKWAGHSTASFTLDRYAHFFPKDDAQYMTLLDGYTQR
ncbi:MAG: tyrosine-type recombinase/integrase [Ornithinimicrobium sp.]